MRRGCGDVELYDELEGAARTIRERHADANERLSPLCDLLWDALASRGLSWVGFYLASNEDALQLELAARRDKPACSPIGLHGVCGQAFQEEAIRLVEDTALLGPSYIACDPRDRSEIVVPIYRKTNPSKPWGVLDLDSHALACFSDADSSGLSAILSAAGLLDRRLPLRSDRLP